MTTATTVMMTTENSAGERRYFNHTRRKQGMKLLTHSHVWRPGPRKVRLDRRTSNNTNTRE